MLFSASIKPSFSFFPFFSVSLCSAINLWHRRTQPGPKCNVPTMSFTGLLTVPRTLFLWTSKASVATKVTWHFPVRSSSVPYPSVWNGAERLLARRPQQQRPCGDWRAWRWTAAHCCAAAGGRRGERKSWPVLSAPSEKLQKLDPMIQSVCVI